ncbi:multidrug resistance protein [Purpureocillium lilacinum]|uniref:Multidrug resistance protein n=1 Tax=Purpureocillium lilacinum TaxID=33203 RepID=A0A179GXY9_PURLI|nr:multidrug resistance protein [Purpureocillium lilacinum]OAQ82754.1 multidrug resistance protein [Purpureocillium lilacinum]
MSADPDGEKVQVHGQQHQHHHPDDVERPPSVTTETTSTAHEGPGPDDDENDEDDDYATERDLEKADHIVSATFPGEAAGGGTTVRAGSPGLDHHHHHRSGPGSAPDPDLEEKTVGDDAVVARRSPSRASSARSRPLTIVPRHRRRGLFGRFTIVPEVKRPYDYKNSTKWGLTATVAFATIAAPLGSSIFYPALPVLTRELNTTQTVTNLSVAMYMLAMSIFPLWWSSFSEQLGRRTVYLVSFSLFVVFSVLCAVSTSAAMLVVFRVLTGGASASVQAVGAGTIADIWEPRERGRAMSMFYLGPLLGPIVAPVVGGVLAQKLGWQSTQYFLAIYGAVILLMLFFLLPETLARRRADDDDDNDQQQQQQQQGAGQGEQLQRTTTAQSAKIKTQRLARAVKRVVIDPLSVLLFLRFPPVLITVLVAAIAFGALFVANISIQQTFSAPPYGFPQLIVGLLYVPLGLGYFSASFFGGRWIDNIMAREARKANRYDEHGKLVYLPEDRMRENMWIANTVYPLGLLLFGWTLRYGVFWFVPSLGGFFFGVSSMLVFSAATTMLTEFVHKRSSAGVAVNNFVRNILSCVGTVVAAPWINAIGTGWVFTIIAVFCLASGYFGIWILRRNAPRWRKDMDEAMKKIR